MATFTWAVTAMDCYPQEAGQTDVVFTVHWTLEGTDGTYSASVYGTSGVTYTAGEPFTPYSSLTQSQVVGWVQAALGQEQVDALEANVAGQISAQANPTVVTPPLPWVA